MKAVILAGGMGTRLSEETGLKPKPMVEIGGKPILWHIMKIYSRFGINDFVICLGYKGYIIKEYFYNYLLHTADVTIDVQRDAMEIHEMKAEPWRVTLVDTGEHTGTAGRLRRVAKYLDEDTFCFTYGDGLADIDLGRLLEFHQSHERLVTVTAVRTPGRFGILKLKDNRVEEFVEKPAEGAGWINGGFFVLNRRCLEYITDDNHHWEKEPLINLANNNEMMAYCHEGFWQPMDTLRDRNYLESLWKSSNAPWKLWV
jgi:glucose-1-phosphate cytidylyltransferase